MAVYTGHWPNWLFSKIYLDPKRFCIFWWIITTTLNTTITCKFLAISWRLSSSFPGVQDIVAWGCVWFPGATCRDSAGSQVITCLLGAGGCCELGSYSIHCCLIFQFSPSSLRAGECLLSLCWWSQFRHWLWNCLM